MQSNPETWPVEDERFDPSAPDPLARRRRWPLAAGAAALVLLLAWGFRERPIPVEIAEVVRGPLRVTIDEEGRTHVRDRYVVASPAAGQLRRVTLKPGDVVKAGETVLFELETAGAALLDASALEQAQARVGAAEGALEAARARLEAAEAARAQAEVEWARLEALAGGGVASAQERESAELRARTAAAEARAARFAVRVAEFELEQARALVRSGKGERGGGDGGRTAVRSPVDGVVLRVFQESERPVPAGLGILEVGDPGDLEVRVELLSRDAVAVRPGAEVWVERWGGEGSLIARVRRVEPAAFTKISALGVEEQRVNLIADFADDAAGRAGLGDGYRVEVRIVAWAAEDVLQAPAGAFFQRGAEWRVFAVEGGRARERAVRVGRSNGVDTLVLGGLSAGERVVVFPGDQVRDGTRVSPR